MRVLIDSDIIVYRCGFAAQTTQYRDVTDPSRVFSTITEAAEAGVPKEALETEVIAEPVENALHSVNNTITNMLKDLGAEQYSCFLTGKGNYREDIATIKPYKGNRDRAARPYHYDAITEHLKSRWGAHVITGMEADDALGIELYKDYMEAKRFAAITGESPEEQKPQVVLASIDKDLDMIPGWHYNFVEKDLYFISEDKAMRNFYVQLLAGDAVDNIPGVPGISVTKAKKLLKECKTEQEMLCVAGFHYATAKYRDVEYNDPEAALVENARLLWIQRDWPKKMWSLEEHV